MLLAFLMTFNAYAAIYDCRDGDSVDRLILENHSVQVLGVKMINMMEIDWNLPYRGYARIGDPWYALDVDMDMMNGKSGYAILRAHELQYGRTVVSKYYQCEVTY